MPVQTTHSLIVGASISGLACAACLLKKKIPYIIIDKESQPAAPWRNHYDRLHLHTNKRLSNLPYKKFDKSVPRYPSRLQVLDYLDSYQKEFNITPLLHTEAISIKKIGDEWETLTTNGTFRSKYVIMATGAFGVPRPVDFKGSDSFTGKIIHSYNYKSGKEFEGTNVLVIGFGNSACEIAIDLYEQGAHATMSVRSPVNIVPRDIGGISVTELSLLMNRLSPRVADRINAPLLRLMVGNLSKLGLTKKKYGPLEQIRKEGRAPVLDIGTIRHIRQGHIKIETGIDRIVGKIVHFTNGHYGQFDTIVAAIGYRRNYAEILQVDKSRFEDLNVKLTKQKYFGNNGLYFCGYWISPAGQIREIASDALTIAGHIAAKESTLTATRSHV